MSAMLRPTLEDYQAALQNDFVSFIQHFFYELNPKAVFVYGQYIELLAATLERVRAGEIRRLIINMPPRTLKSHVASVALPAWLLGHNPSAQIICASYGQDLADKHARDCRTLMGSAMYRLLFPGTVLSLEKSSVNDFMTTEQGFRMSTSVGGVLTGRGADIIILDDVMKPEEAMSETRRKTINEWYPNTLQSRLNSKDKGVLIIVMQRLHGEDLVGEVLAREPWEVLSLPAIAVQDECYEFDGPFGPQIYERKTGEALHPERDSVETYLRIRETVGEYIFQSQYQQNPTPREGGTVKSEWIKYYEPTGLPRFFDHMLQSWDTANKVGELNDYSVCTTWGLHDGSFYLLDVFRKRLNYPDLKRAVIEHYNKYQPTKVLIEDKSSGIALIQDLKSEYLCGLEGYQPPPGSDKRMRFGAQSIKFENGRVYLPNKAPWLEEYVKEITGFPGTKYDDQVDSTSQALETLTSLAPWTGPFRGFGYSRGYESC